MLTWDFWAAFQELTVGVVIFILNNMELKKFNDLTDLIFNTADSSIFYDWSNKNHWKLPLKNIWTATKVYIEDLK